MRLLLRSLKVFRGKAINALKSVPAVTSKTLLRFMMIEVPSITLSDKMIKNSRPTGSNNFLSTAYSSCGIRYVYVGTEMQILCQKVFILISNS
jgi:hypothetical protein